MRVTALTAMALVASGCGRYAFDPLGIGGDDTASDANEQGSGDGGDGGAAATGANVVFVSSTTMVPGMWGGDLAIPDAECKRLAIAAGLPDGDYVAWLATATTNAASRLGGRGWVRPDGLPFADEIADLVAGAVFYPPELDENGNVMGFGTNVTTGAYGDGGVHFENCTNFTSTTGNILTGNPWRGADGWSSGTRAIGGCVSSHHLYCFGVGRDVAIAPAPEVGPRIFLSSSWIGTDGIAAADARCAQDAATAGLPGTFRAFLSTTTQSAAARGTPVGPLVRPDGVRVAASWAAFLAGELDAAPAAYANTATYPRTRGIPLTVWSGSPNPSSVGADADSCRDWNMSNGTALVGDGRDTMSSYFGFLIVDPCTSSHPVYCLEY